MNAVYFIEHIKKDYLKKREPYLRFIYVCMHLKRLKLLREECVVILSLPTAGKSFD